MSTKTVAEKLGVGPGDRLLALGAPGDYAATVGPLPGDVDLVETPHGTHDVVQIFARNETEFEDRIETAETATARDGRLWVTYPKRSAGVESDLDRDRVAALMRERGWRGARQVAVDDTWSAIWFRPTD